MNEIAGVFIMDQTIGGNQGAVNGRSPGDKFHQCVFPSEKRQMLFISHGLKIQGKFHLTQIDDPVFPINDHIDLRTRRIRRATP